MFSGRSISIYKASDMSLTWDSGSQIETEGCARFPWAHNGVQDEEFALVNGTLYKMDADMAETIDEMSDAVDGDGCDDRGDGKAGPCPLGKTVDERSPKDGPALESVVSGIACGRLIMVTAGEKNGVLFAWDISDITSPSLLFVDHLSPASQTKSPGIAYGDGSLGEVDPESMIFLDDQHSPSGKAGVLIAGAWSGSVSWWEFECKETMTTTNKDITTSSSAVRSWQPMAASSSSRPSRRGQAAESMPAEEPVYSFVRKLIFERLKSSNEVKEEDVKDLTALEEAEDDEMLIPVDLRERLNQSADAMKAEMKDPRKLVEAYARAEQLFVEDKTPKQGRPVAMTAKAWKEQNLEDGSEFDEKEVLDFDEVFEMGEEEDLEYDEEIDLDDDASNGPAAKKARIS